MPQFRYAEESTFNRDFLVTNKHTSREACKRAGVLQLATVPSVVVSKIPIFERSPNRVHNSYFILSGRYQHCQAQRTFAGAAFDLVAETGGARGQQIFRIDETWPSSIR